MADTPPEPSPPTRKQGRGPGKAQGTGQATGQGSGQGTGQGSGQGSGAGQVPSQGPRKPGTNGGATPAASPPTRAQRATGSGGNGGAATPTPAPAANSSPAKSRAKLRLQRPGAPATGSPATGGANATPAPAAPTTPAGSPPTRLQNPRGPATPARPDPRTRLQRPGPATPPTARVNAATPTPAPAPGSGLPATFPTALTARFQPLGEAGSGSEGTVWHVRRIDGAGAVGDAAVKVGNPGVEADTELLAHLGSDPAFRRHVPEILGHGRVEHAGVLRDWMAMEYLPVTLADHVASLRHRGRLDRPGEIERIIRELVALLDFWQNTVHRNPVDFKPANILVRTRGSAKPQFVVADFGGVAKLTASRSFMDLQVTAAFMAPEQLIGRNHQAGPWWSLGTILYEVFTGQTRYRRADGDLVNDEALHERLLIDDEVDLAAVTDPRQRLLLQGLFTKDPADRWTAPQVREWLNGGSPDVVRNRVAQPSAPEPPPAAPAHRPIAFRGEDFHDPAALAEALLARSADAAAWLVGGAAGGGARRLRDWLRDEVKDTVFDLHYLKDVERGTPAERSAAASRAVLALGAAFTPAAVPHVRDRRVDAAGLAQQAEEPDALTFVEELVAAGLPALAARFHCGHEGCPEQACARLLALTQLPAVLTVVEREARTLGARGGGGGDGRLSAAERRTARRWALLLTVQPDGQRRAVVRRLAALPGPLRALPGPAQKAAAVVADGVGTVTARVRGGGREQFRRNWSDLRRRALTAAPDTVEGRGLLASAAVLQVRSVRAGGAQRGRNRGAWRAGARAWWGGAQSALPRRAMAAALILIALSITLWAGAVWRIAIDSGTGAEVLPGGAFDGPLRTAGEVAARGTAGQLGAALAAAVAVAAFPARVGRRMLFLAVAASFTIGYLHLGPPMTVLKPPQAVVDRVVMFEGGLASWAGAGSVAAVVLALMLNSRTVRWLLTPADEAAQRARADRLRLATRRRARTGGEANRWREGRDGYRDRLLFWLGGTAVLTLLLWAAVEVRVAVVTRDHPGPAVWGTGQAGAAYQADFLLLLAFLALLSATALPQAARRLLAGSALGAVALGAWPPPLGPFEALRIPVLGAWFRPLGELWGHASFWAAVLVVLPLACYLAVWTLRRIAPDPE
ncbi:hypothetical protein [Kitasatospora sp. NPDC093806]|uniref:protein kinase domain-containing protein n=1 Tax=Kitasatospora sp. NPDC093806 TaxID=3155075 RepID=UPI003431AD79